MAKRTARRQVRIFEVSSCHNPANPGSRVALIKTAEAKESDMPIDRSKLDKNVLAELEKAEGDAQAAKAENDELKKKLAAGGNPPADPAKPDLSKLDAEARKQVEIVLAENANLRQGLAKAEEGQNELKTRLDKMEREKLEAEIGKQIADVALEPDARAAMVKTLADMEKGARDVMIGTLTKQATQLKSSSIFKEIGGSGSGNADGSAKAEVAKRVEEMRKTAAWADKSDSQVRAHIFKGDRELKDRYNAEMRG